MNLNFKCEATDPKVGRTGEDNERKPSRKGGSARQDEFFRIKRHLACPWTEWKVARIDINVAVKPFSRPREGVPAMSCTRGKQYGVSNALHIYLREIKDESLLTAEEECTLAEAIARGDSDARARMIQANLRLVVKIARDYVGRGLVLEDLIGEGNLGLIRATEEFEPRFGTRFSTYASYWIKQSIRHALINTTSTIRLPAHMVGLLTKWRRAERAIYREQGRSPTFGEVACVLGLSETQKSLVAKACQARQLKLQSGLSTEKSRWLPEESRDHEESPEARLEADEERNVLLSRLQRLEPRERTILALRYGLEGELPLTLKEIGRRLGVTREWVRKIELRAVRKLDDDYAEQRAAGFRPPCPARSDERSGIASAVPQVSSTVCFANGRSQRRKRLVERPVSEPAPRSARLARAMAEAILSAQR